MGAISAFAEEDAKTRSCINKCFRTTVCGESVAVAVKLPIKCALVVV